MQDVRFGFQAAAADVAGIPDDQLYRDLIADCALGHRLGYDAAWLLESAKKPRSLRAKRNLQSVKPATRRTRKCIWINMLDQNPDFRLDVLERVVFRRPAGRT